MADPWREHVARNRAHYLAVAATAAVIIGALALRIIR